MCSISLISYYFHIIALIFPVIFPIISTQTIIFPIIFLIITLLYHNFEYYFLLFQGDAAQLTGAARHASSSFARTND